MATQAQIDSSIDDLVKMGVLPAPPAKSPSPPSSVPMPDLGLNEAHGPGPAVAKIVIPDPLPPIGPPRPPLEPRAGPPKMIATLPGAGVPPADAPIGSLDLGLHGAHPHKSEPLQAPASKAPIGPLDVGLLRPGGPVTLSSPSKALASIASPVEQPSIAPSAAASGHAPTAADGSEAAGEGQYAAAPAVPAATFVKAHFDDSRLPFRKDTIAAEHKAEGDEITAVDAMAKARVLEADVTANQLGEQAMVAKQQIAEREAMEDARRAQVAASQSKLQSTVDEAASDKIDPAQWWDSRNAFQKVMATAAVAIGGAWGGKGADIVNQQIEQNVNAQKANADLRKSGISNRVTALGALRDQFGDDRQGDIALDMAQREAAISKMQSLVSTTKNPQLRAQADEVIAQLRQVQAKRQEQFDQLSFVQAHMAGGPLGGKVNQDRIITMPDGRKLVARSDKEAQDARNKIGTVQNIQANIERALAIRKEAGPLDLVNPHSAVRKQLDSLQAETAQLVTVGRGQGAMSKGDQEVADVAIGSMTGLLGSNDDVLRSTSKRWNDQLDREVKGMGAEQIETGYGYDPTGHVAPKAAYVGDRDKPRAAMPAGFVPDKR